MINDMQTVLDIARTIAIAIVVFGLANLWQRADRRADYWRRNYLNAIRKRDQNDVL